MKKNLFIILFHNPWEWTADFANQTAYELNKKNYVVCVLFGDAKSLRELVATKHRWQICQINQQGLYLFTPLHLLPFRRFKQIQTINILMNILLIRVWIYFFQRKHVIYKKFIWIFYPGHYGLLRFFNKSFSVNYDCVDYFIGYRGPTDKRLIIDEKKLILTADLFCVNSTVLFNRHKAIRKAFVVPQGFRLNQFNTATKDISIILPRDKPIIGYIGGINYRLDYQLLTTLLQDNPQYNFVFIGPIQKLDTRQFLQKTKSQINILFKNKNCLYYPNQSKSTIASCIKQFSICMLPYNVAIEFNKYCYPMKLFEYFYMGKPVIATPIEELRRFSKYVKLGANSNEWQEHIDQLLYKPWPDSYKKAQRELARRNTWTEKIAAINVELKNTNQLPDQRSEKMHV